MARLFRGVCTALTAAVLAAPLAHAQDEKQLEDWQERILRALEDADPEKSASTAERGEGAGAPAARQGYSAQPGTDAAAARAAEEARRRYGGQALAVVRVGEAYRVRLLLDSGRVTTVTIRD